MKKYRCVPYNAWGGGHVLSPGADPENIEPGGANSKHYQTEPGGANIFFGPTYKGERGGGVRRVRPPLNPRLVPVDI